MNEPSPPSSRLSPEATRSALWFFNLSASFRGVFDTVCGGTTVVFVAFALSLGLPEQRMGLITSVVSCACIMQMLVLPWVGQVGNKKRFIIVLATIEPLLMIAAVVSVPFLPAGCRLYVLGLAAFLAAAALHLRAPLSEDWFASTIPAGIRGRYLGRRMQILSVTVIVTTLILGKLMGWVGQTNTAGLAVLLAIGGVCGVVAVAALNQAAMPTLAAASEVQLTSLPNILRTRPFVRVLAVMIVYNLPFYFACPYYQVFNLRVLQMSTEAIAVMQSGYLVVKILTLPVIGRLTDRLGARLTLYLAGIIYVAFFLTFPFCHPERTWPLFVAWAVVGAADAAFTLAYQTALYASVPETPERPAYFAVCSFVSLSLAALFAGLVVPLLEALKDRTIVIGDLTMGGFHLLYFGCAVALIPCLAISHLLPGRRR